MAKSPDAFRTISEVADWLGVEAHVLRFWETKFTQVKPVKRAGGRRYYRPSDMALLGGIRRLLHDEGMTIRGVQKVLREKGASHVAGVSPDLDLGKAEAPAAARPRRVAETADAVAAPPPKSRPAEVEAPRLPFDLPEPAPPAAPVAAMPADQGRSDGRDHAHAVPASDSSGNGMEASGRLHLRPARLDPVAAAEVLARARALVERLRTTPE